jgi:hypothetical protein
VVVGEDDRRRSFAHAEPAEMLPKWVFTVTARNMQADSDLGIRRAARHHSRRRRRSASRS